MKLMKLYAAVCCLAALAGCASMFGRSSSDPAVKLQWASELFSSKDDPIQAEKLIRDAIDLYELQRNHLGLAEAYRQYGLFFRSNAVTKFEEHYTVNGFLDEKARYKDRYNKAIEYFNKSKNLYADYGKNDDLSELYISLAKTYDLMGRQDEACNAFSKSIESFARFKSENKESQEQNDLQIANYIEYVGLMKKQAGCPEIVPPPPPPPAPKPAPTSPYAPSEQPNQPEPKATTSPYAPTDQPGQPGQQAPASSPAQQEQPSPPAP